MMGASLKLCRGIKLIRIQSTTKLDKTVFLKS